jgi:ribosome biogenesis GTPase / thiamine phosphate phosphatase
MNSQDSQEGIILKSFCGYFHIKSQNNNVYLAKPRGKIKATTIYVGDTVTFKSLNDKEAVIEKIQPRNNQFSPLQISNVDQVFIVFSLAQPDLSLYLLDKFLVLAHLFEIPIKLIFTKADLDKNNLAADLIFYEQIGYESFFISTPQATGLDKVIAAFKNKKSLITGPSGVGKSTLLNTIHPNLNLKIGDLSKINRGKHTTRYAELIEIDNNSFVIDTPGFTNVDIKILPEELQGFFPEFGNYSNNCKFNNCLHLKEPNCAVKKAIKEKNIALSRHENYIKIYEDIKHHRKWNLKL